MKSLERILTYVGFAIVIVAIFIIKRDIGGQIADVKEYWENMDFKTDTVKVEVDYSKLPKPGPTQYIPPAVVVNYIDSTKTNNTFLVLEDSLLTIIDSLTKKIATINDNFILQYPFNPKLVYGTFLQDTLRLDLLDIDGNIRSHYYPVNYRRFDYIWSDNTMGIREAVNTKPSISSPVSIYGYGGYGFGFNGGVIGGDISYNINKMRLSNSTFVVLNKNPHVNSMFTVGYRIK